MRRGSASPETIIALAVLALVMTAGLDAARAVGTALGVQRAADAAAWAIMLQGSAADPSTAAQGALTGVPLYGGTGFTLQVTPSTSAAWTFQTPVCVQATARYATTSPLLPGLQKDFVASRCVYVQKWP